MISGMGLGMSILDNLVWAVEKCRGQERDVHRLADRQSRSGLRFLLAVATRLADEGGEARGDIRRTGMHLNRMHSDWLDDCNFTEIDPRVKFFSGSMITEDDVPVTILHGDGRCFSGRDQIVHHLAEACYRPATFVELLALCASDQLNMGLTFSFEPGSADEGHGLLVPYIEENAQGRFLRVVGSEQIMDVMIEYQSLRMPDPTFRTWIAVVRDVDAAMALEEDPSLRE